MRFGASWHGKQIYIVLVFSFWKLSVEDATQTRDYQLRNKIFLKGYGALYLQFWLDYELCSSKLFLNSSRQSIGKKKSFGTHVNQINSKSDHLKNSTPGVRSHNAPIRLFVPVMIGKMTNSNSIVATLLHLLKNDESPGNIFYFPLFFLNVLNNIIRAWRWICETE